MVLLVWWSRRYGEAALWWSRRCGETAVTVKPPLRRSRLMVKLPLWWSRRCGETAVTVKPPLRWSRRYGEAAVTAKPPYGEAAVMVKLPLWCSCCYGEAAVMVKPPLWWSCRVRYLFFTSYGLAWSITGGLVSMLHFMVGFVLVLRAIMWGSQIHNDSPLWLAFKPRFSQLRTQRPSNELFLEPGRKSK